MNSGKKYIPSKLIDDMKKLRSIPPYNESSNIVAGDGYFARDIEKRCKQAGVTWDEVAAAAEAG